MSMKQSFKTIDFSYHSLITFYSFFFFAFIWQTGDRVKQGSSIMQLTWVGIKPDSPVYTVCVLPSEQPERPRTILKRYH